VDETSLPFRTKDEPVAATPGRSHEGKLLLAGAVEIKGKAPGRARLAVIESYAAKALHDFVATAIAKGSTVVSDGWWLRPAQGREARPQGRGTDGGASGATWVHRTFANAKRWALGVYHGPRRKHLQSYLDEFVFRFNRRRTPAAAFARLLDLSLAHPPITYQMLISRA
jgi:ISXO2-like transposase domain